MYFGEIVEIGPAQEIFTKPKHPYTKLLAESAPKIGTKLQLNENQTQIYQTQPIHQKVAHFLRDAITQPINA